MSGDLNVERFFNLRQELQVEYARQFFLGGEQRFVALPNALKAHGNVNLQNLNTLLNDRIFWIQKLFQAFTDHEKKDGNMFMHNLIH